MPGFSLQGESSDIIKALVLIFLGAYLFSWVMSGIWLRPLRAQFRRAKAERSWAAAAG